MQGHNDWPVNKDWQQGQSRPEQVNLRFYMAAGATLVYLGIMLTVNLTQWNELEAALYRLQASDFSQFDPLLLIPGMLLLGLLGLPRLVREYRRWQRDRGLIMLLDPVPASPEGQLGGSLTLPTRLSDGAPIRVTLNCMRRVVTHGKNASIRDELLWQTPAATRQLPSVKGTRLEFCAELSPQQPETRYEEGKRKIWWAVHVEEPESGLDVTFPVPVSEQARKPHSDYRFTEQEKHRSLEAAREPVDSWQVSGTVDGVRVDYPAGRSAGMAWVLLLVGLVFTGVMAFMGYNIHEEFNSARISYFALMVQGVILFGFGLFGPGLLLMGLYMMLNRLTLEMNARQLITTRSILGLTRRQQIPVSEIEGLVERVTGSVGQGVDARREYAIEAWLKDGRRVRLGDGIQGQQAVEQLLQQLREITGILDRPDPSRQRQRQAQRGRGKWLWLFFKLINILVVGLVLAAFAMDFL